MVPEAGTLWNHLGQEREWQLFLRGVMEPRHKNQQWLSHQTESPYRNQRTKNAEKRGCLTQGGGGGIGVWVNPIDVVGKA